MSRVIKITTANAREQLRAAIARPGYAIVVLARAGDWACELFASRCAEWSREFPFVRFIIADADLADALGGLDGSAGSATAAMQTTNARAIRPAPFAIAHPSFVPTTIVFRNGAAREQIVGTDCAQMERILIDMRRDGPSLAPSAPYTGKNYICAPENVAIFARRRRV
jgi:hypothetical protein